MPDIANERGPAAGAVDWARGYLLVQSVLIPTWWGLLVICPGWVSAFAPTSAGGWAWLKLFLPADVVTCVGGVAAVCLWHRPGGRYALFATATGMLTQTAGCLFVSLRHHDAWLSTAVMGLSSLGTLACGGVMLRHLDLPGVFRPAAETSVSRLAWRTVGQATVLWTVFLGWIPWALTKVEGAMELAHEWPRVWTGVGCAVFAAAGALNVWAARTMVVRGKGTPLPSCMARHLVITGPYAWVRNPMAVSALAQGAAVGLMLGSWLTLLYVVAGGLFWHLVVRPAEEHDLELRFGDEFRRYRSAVRCWWPVLRR